MERLLQTSQVRQKERVRENNEIFYISSEGIRISAAKKY